MKRMLLIVTVLAGSASSLAAQTVTGTTVTITNTTTSLQTTAALTGVVCGQPKYTGTTTVNPRKIIWSDSTNAALDCIWTDPGTGILVALPFGPATYTATAVAINSAGTSPPSLPSLPFTSPGLPPGAPTAVRVVQ